jgi:hypothetical protein
MSRPGHRLHLDELLGAQVDGAAVDGIAHQEVSVGMHPVAMEHGQKRRPRSEAIDPLPHHFS